MKRLTAIAVAAAAVVAASAAFAQQPGRGPGQGPVITQCKDDIAKHCAGKAHDGETRACLEAKKAEVSPACKTALDTTGKGKAKGK
jgi:hypothetical protein